MQKNPYLEKSETIKKLQLIIDTFDTSINALKKTKLEFINNMNDIQKTCTHFDENNVSTKNKIGQDPGGRTEYICSLCDKYF